MVKVFPAARLGRSGIHPQPEGAFAGDPAGPDRRHRSRERPCLHQGGRSGGRCRRGVGGQEGALGKAVRSDHQLHQGVPRCHTRGQRRVRTGSEYPEVRLEEKVRARAIIFIRRSHQLSQMMIVQVSTRIAGRVLYSTRASHVLFSPSSLLIPSDLLISDLLISVLPPAFPLVPVPTL